MTYTSTGRSRRSSGPRSRRMRAATAVGLALAIPLTAAPAMAALQPVTLAHQIEVFPTIDMAGAAGFSSPFVMEVWREGVMVGTSGAPSSASPLELNHDGPPCWKGVTPDIIAGDEIRVVNAETVDLPEAEQVGEYLTVADIDADRPKLVALDDDGLPNDVVMTGTATAQNGTSRLDITHMEAAIRQRAWQANGWERKDIAAVSGGELPDATTPLPDGGTGVLSYDPVDDLNPLGNHWTAVWKNMPDPHATLALSGEPTLSYFERPGGVEGTGLTIVDADDASGPGVGCPAAASDAVTGTSPVAANKAFVNGDAPMKVSGTAYNAASVRVTLDDADGNPGDAITVNGVLSRQAQTGETSAPVAPVRQTWTASFANHEFDGLEEGDLTVSAEFARAIEAVEEREVTDPDTGAVTTERVYTHETTLLPGRDHVVLKDTVAPQMPTAFPAPGAYTSAQQVTISPANELEDVVRFKVGDGTQLDPTVGSPVAPVPYKVASNQTIKARSFDSAGNGSEVAPFAYTFFAAVTPAPPTGVTAVGGASSATVSWMPPTKDGGKPITEYKVQVFTGTSTNPSRTVSVKTPQPTSNPGELSTSIGSLAGGTSYRFKVAAFNGTLGLLAYSPFTNTVVPTAGGGGGPVTSVPGAPAIGTPVKGDRQATVKWTAPTTGGGGITGYRVQVITGTTLVRTDTVAGTVSSAVVTGLTNGTPYKFRVRAVNSAGLGALSRASTVVTPAAPTPTTGCPVDRLPRGRWRG